MPRGLKKYVRNIIGEERYVELHQKIAMPIRGFKSALDGKSIYMHCDRRFKNQLVPYGDVTYGIYKIYDKYLTKDSIVYSFGIGQDATFDMMLMNKIGCKVYAFDPDRLASEYVVSTGLVDNPLFSFSNSAVSGDGAVINYFEYEKTEEEDGSGSFYCHTDGYIGQKELKTTTIGEIMSTNGHTHVDLLKMDVEGAEYEIINCIAQSSIPISQITMEMHGRFFSDCREKNIKLRQQMRELSFIPIWNQMWYGGQEVTFLNTSII